MSAAGATDAVVAAGGMARYARQAGSGRPVLFGHAAAGDHEIWAGAVEAVADRFRAIAYSRRGYHPNPAPSDGSHRFEEHLDDLLAVIDGIGGNILSLVGHSSGGVIALLAAARRPETVRRMVLIEPPSFTLYVGDPPRPGEILRLLRRDPALALGLIRFAAAALAPARAAARRGDRAAAIRHFAKLLGRRAFRGLSQARRQVERNFYTDELLKSAFPRIDPGEVARLACPVLVVAGAQIPAFQGVLARRLTGALPRGEHRVVPGASLIVHEDAPAAFQRALVDFLDRTG